MSSFSSCLRLHLEAIFSVEIFLWQLKAAPGPNIFFLSRLGISSGPLRTSKMCVLLKEKHHFCIFVYVVLGLDLGPSKSSSGGPKVGPVNFFKFRRADFIGSLKFSKKFKRPTWAPRGRFKRPKIGPKSISKGSFFHIFRI